jgi:hypothetical protein
MILYGHIFTKNYTNIFELKIQSHMYMHARTTAIKIMYVFQETRQHFVAKRGQSHPNDGLYNTGFRFQKRTDDVN